MWKENNPILRKLRKFTIKALSKWDDPPYNEHSLWKMGVERLLSFWKGPIFREYFSFRECILPAPWPFSTKASKHLQCCLQSDDCNLVCMEKAFQNHHWRFCWWTDLFGSLSSACREDSIAPRPSVVPGNPVMVGWQSAIGQASQWQKHGQSIWLFNRELIMV